MPLTGNPNARNQLKMAGLTLGTGVVLYLCYRILVPFFPALTWAIALAVVARPLHRVLDRSIRNRALSSLLAVVIIAVAIVLPLALVTEQVVSEAVSAVRSVRSPDFQNKVNSALASHPRIAHAVDWMQARVNLGEQAKTLAGSAGARVSSAFAGSVAGIGQLLIALFTVFFLLRDFELFIDGIRSLIPLPRSDADDILKRVQQTIDASIRGRVFIAVIQGALGGLMFWVLGLPAPLLWGSVMAMFALVPMLGAFVVWVPAALFLLLTGHAGKAVILAAWGTIVIGSADNFLYPLLVGKDIKMHTLLIFFSVLGGVAAFGASGLVVGPVVFALADALIAIWTRRSEPAVDATTAS